MKQMTRQDLKGTVKKAQIKAVEWLTTTASYHKLNIYHRNSKW